MNSLVSICIPTYKRPEQLLWVVRSSLNQTHQNIEIIISDDSPDDRSKRAIAGLNQPEKIRYYRNEKSLGQARNVNQLFRLARGDRLVLIHDDDWLLPHAVSTLLAQWETHPGLVACFGKQFLATAEGEILEKDSWDLNRQYYREQQYAGLQRSSQWSALMGQFPNNGYMVLTQVAQRIGYRHSAEVGDACDYDFGLRLAEQNARFYFIDEYVSAYRMNAQSILTNNNYCEITYRLVEKLSLPTELESARLQRLQRYASPAVSKLLRTDRKSEAWRIYCSPTYSLRDRLSFKGLVHLLLLCVPGRSSFYLSQVLNRLRNGSLSLGR